MQEDPEFQATQAALKAKGQAQLTREEAKARKRSLQGLDLPSFPSKMQVCLQGLPTTTHTRSELVQRCEGHNFAPSAAEHQ